MRALLLSLPVSGGARRKTKGKRDREEGGSSERKEMGSGVAAALEGVEGERLGWPSGLGLGAGRGWA